MIDPELRDRMSDALMAERLEELRSHLATAAAAGAIGADHRYFEGALARREGRLDEAIALLEAATAADPEQAAAWGELGFAYAGARRPTQALRALRMALSYAPDEPALLLCLAQASQVVEDYSTARWAFRRVLDADKTNWAVHAGLGVALAALGETEDAIEHLRLSVAGSSANADVWEQLGQALIAAGRFDEAEAAFRHAAEIEYASAVDRDRRTGELLTAGRLAFRALRCFDAALAVDDADAHARLGKVMALRALGRGDEALAVMQALLRDGDGTLVEDNFHVLADLLNENPPETMAAYQADRKIWAARYASPALAARAHANAPDSERPLRIGYASSTFRRNSSNEIVLPVIAGHDRRNFEVAIFADLESEDDVTERYRALAGHWVDLKNLDHRRRAEAIRASGIDILVDIAGHSRGGLLGAFAYKPAPIQVTAWGFPTGTGMSQVDWIFADRLFIRPEEQTDMAEGVWYLPNWAGYAPPALDLEPGPLPAGTNGFVTFGSFCRAEKLTATVLETWSRILAAVPQARMVVKTGSLRTDQHVDSIRRTFAARGIATDRLEIVGKTDKAEQLATHRRVDLVLDAFPQVGGIATFEALWMGVPVLTLYGKVPSSRGAASILNAVGLSELIAGDAEDYVARALALAGDLERLEALRRVCRERLVTSPAGNPALYVRAVEAAYREMWRRWCAARQT